MSSQALEEGYWQAYRDFYRWSAIWQGAMTKADWLSSLRHVGYAAGWKKFEPVWDWIIRARRAGQMLPVLETLLSGFGKHQPSPLNEAENTATPKVKLVELVNTES
jgi:hypothetical protein